MSNKKGYRAQCINVGATINLEKYEYYYLYPNGKDKFYVSKSPYSQRRHFGCYHKLHFRLIDEIPEKEEAAADEVLVVEGAQEIVSAPEIQEQMSLF